MANIEERLQLRESAVKVCSDLASQLEGQGLFCLVGSGVFEIFGHRAAVDIDIILSPTISSLDRERLLLVISDKVFRRVSVTNDRYLRSGVDDLELFDDIQSVAHPAGFRIARPELEFARKNHIRREKDLEDLTMMTDLIEKNQLPLVSELPFPSWDWLKATTKPKPESSSPKQKISLAAGLLVSNP